MHHLCAASWPACDFCIFLVFFWVRTRITWSSLSILDIVDIYLGMWKGQNWLQCACNNSDLLLEYNKCWWCVSVLCCTMNHSLRHPQSEMDNCYLTKHAISTDRCITKHTCGVDADIFVMHSLFNLQNKIPTFFRRRYCSCPIFGRNAIKIKTQHRTSKIH